MTKLQKIRNWLNQPLTKKEVKKCAYVFPCFFVFDMISAIIEFKLKHSVTGVIDVLFSIFTLGVALLCIYVLKTNFKEEK